MVYNTSSHKSSIVFIENNDSFSWNVMDSLPFSRAEIKIMPNYGFTAGQNLEPVFEEARAVVIGPGPMDPLRTGLIEIVNHCAARKIPTLGICLGFEAIGLAFGANLVRMKPVQGKRSLVVFYSSRFFPGFNGRDSKHGAYTVMRYHSLGLKDIKEPLKVIASTYDSIPMAVEHEFLPIAGFQFHPDSFATERGTEMLHSFFENAL